MSFEPLSQSQNRRQQLRDSWQCVELHYLLSSTASDIREIFRMALLVHHPIGPYADVLRQWVPFRIPTPNANDHES